MLLASYERVDIVGADGVLAEIEALTEKVGLPYQRWQHGQYVSGRLLLAGKAFEAETANERLLELGTAADVPQALSTFGGILRGIREHQGRLDEVADFFVDAARDNPSVAALPSAVVSLLCELGRIDEASVQLAAEAATGFDFPYDGTWLASMSNLIDAAATVQDPASARTLVERVAPFATHHRNRWSQGERCHRPPARPRRHPAGGLRPGRAVVRDRTRHPQPTPNPLLDRTRPTRSCRDLCFARHAEGDLQRACDLASAAAATADDYGCTGLAKRAAALLTAL